MWYFEFYIYAGSDATQTLRAVIKEAGGTIGKYFPPKHKTKNICAFNLS